MAEFVLFEFYNTLDVYMSSVPLLTPSKNEVCFQGGLVREAGYQGIQGLQGPHVIHVTLPNVGGKRTTGDR